MVEKKSPTWNDVKARLADFNRTNLLALVKDLYGASKDNQAFLMPVLTWVLTRSSPTK